MDKFPRLLLLFLLAGCASPNIATATSVPTPDVWQIAFTSELSWMVGDFHRCLDSIPGVGIVIEETQSLQVTGNNAGFMLHWGNIDPQGLSAYQLGFDRIRVVVHPDNPFTALSFDALKDIFSGKVTDWSELADRFSGPVHPWVYPEHLILQQEIEDVLGIIPSQNQALNVAPDISALIDAIEADPQAIGFIPLLWEVGDIKRLDLVDVDLPPVPVVLLARRPLNSTELNWLSCISETLSH